MQPNIGLASASAVKVAAHYGLANEDGMIALQEVKDMLVQKSVLICPIHCDAPLHWTFLVLWSDEAGRVLDVKYVDWCINMKPNALEKKQMMNHSFLGVFLKIIGNRIDEIIYGEETMAK